MNRQKPDLSNKYLNYLKKRMPLLLFGILFLSFSCKSDIEKVNIFAGDLNLPDQSAVKLEVEYTDTGKLQLRFITPLLNRYLSTDDPFYEFPEGIEIYFYDSNEKEKSIITANYSIYHETSKIWEARDSVVARNIETGEQIETEQMFWNEPEHVIYSTVFTKITNEDGVFFGEKGFEATQDLTEYRLIGSTGTVRVKDEEQSTN
jgi:LPS export ABC transporter protein LptC